MNYEKKFKELYQKLGLGEGNSWWPLDEFCENRQDCWSMIKKKSGYSISMPWVGPKYKSTWILALGINFNGHGGINAYKEVIEDHVMLEFKNGRKKTCSNDKYPGSMFHYRMASYCVAILDHLKPNGWQESGVKDDFPEFEFLNNSFDYIAHTNLIKCSRDIENGKPSNAMWDNCPKKILVKELEILKPQIIVFLGTYVGGYALKHLLVKETDKTPQYDTGFRCYTRELRYSPEPVRCFDFYHPQQRRYKHIELYKRLLHNL